MTNILSIPGVKVSQKDYHQIITPNRAVNFPVDQRSG